MSDCTFSMEFIDVASHRFRLLAAPMRLKILRSLKGGEKTVGQMAAALNAKQPNISKHLKVLTDAAILGKRSEGRSVHYSIADTGIQELIDRVLDSSVRTMKAQAKKLGLRVSVSRIEALMNRPGP
ncbi:MAG: metalloregulator ArsR/SmtB family transcription factor [Terriglobia bacterium]